MEALKASIVMPAYNAGAYIEQAILSILEQTVSDWELLVVNDGSTDNTAAIIDKFAATDSRIKPIHQANSGKPSIARNIALRQAHGDNICFLDADDVWLPTKLSSQLAVLDNNAAIDVVFHDSLYIDQNGETLPGSYLANVKFLERAASYVSKKDELYIGGERFYAFISAYQSSLSTQSIMFRRSLLADEPYWFPEDMDIGEDIDLWFRLVQKSRVVYIDQCLCQYRVHPTSITKNNERFKLGFIKAHSINFERAKLQLNSVEQRAYRQRIAKECAHLAYFYRRQGKNRLAREYYWKSFRLIPAPAQLLNWLKVWLYSAK
ncbi:MAG: glycosyl transferase family 2 [Kangiellaceae bacterium]|nr:glycosyl transferase family 2 [Kangiellaceae bacterium]|tara:strand:+ start:4868 stop:5827 length:960 start_codon:yes stop_codon:yes gene_type:complete